MGRGTEGTHMIGAARGVLLVGESYHNADMFHAIRFLFGDPVIYLRHRNGETLVCSNFERGEAARHGRVSDVLGFEDLGYTDLCRQLKSRHQAFAEVVLRLLQQHEVAAVDVPGETPLHVVDWL